MNRALSFVRLDFITVKPYFTLKNLFIFSGIALVMLISSGTSIAAIAMLMAYAALYTSYPFAVGEQNGIDALYTTLSITRSTVVLGRYLFTLVLDVCAGLFAYTVSFAALTIMQKDFYALESLVITLVMLLLYSVIQAIQLPIYFKLGYAKAKLLAYLPFIGLVLFGLVISKFPTTGISLPQTADPLGWLAANPPTAILCGIVIWLGIIVISYRFSCSYYNKRDF